MAHLVIESMFNIFSPALCSCLLPSAVLLIKLYTGIHKHSMFKIASKPFCVVNNAMTQFLGKMLKFSLILTPQCYSLRFFPQCNVYIYQTLLYIGHREHCRGRKRKVVGCWESVSLLEHCYS